MALNTDIWGDSSTWYATTYTQGSDYSDEDRVYYAQYHIINSNVIDRFPLGEPIDKTISFSGLGAESPHSNLKWFNTELLRQQDAGTKVYTPDKQDSRSVTSFSLAFHGDSGNSSYGQNTQFLVDSNETVRNTNPATMRWAPLPATGIYASIRPITRFNYKNFLCLIRVRAAPTLTGTYRNFDLAEYCDTGHTTHPVIGSVFFVPYVKLPPNTAGDCRPAWDTTGAQAGMYMSVLDSFNGLDTAPYCYNMFTSVDRQILLSGAVTQGGGSIAGGYNSIDCQTDNKAYQGICGSDKWYVYVNRKGAGTTSSNSWVEGIVARDYDETFYEECMRAMACFGYFFTDKRSVAENFDTLGLTDPDIYCGVLDEQLVGHGDYTKGILNVRNQQWDWETSDDSTYDPSISGGGGEGDEPYDAATAYITAGEGINVGGRWYCDDNLNIWLGLINWCNGIDLETYTIPQYFYGQNPIDCILEGKIIFVGDYTFGKIIPSNERVPMALGSYNNGGVGAWAFTNAYPETFDCGDVTIEKIYGDFRDLEPFTAYTVLLPFANSVELPSDLVVGHRVGLTETIDPQSGDLKYRILIDNCEYATATGNCAIDLSINGLEIANYRQQRFRLQTQETTAELNAVASLVGGASGALIAGSPMYKNYLGAASQLFGGFVNASNSMQQAHAYKTESDRLKPAPARIQNSTPNVEWGKTPFPCIVASSPRMLSTISLADYKKRIGYATYTVGKIGEQKYAVVCESVVLSGFSCTDEEMSMIKQLLESGIYIKD